MKIHSEEERREFIKTCPRKRSATGIVLRNRKKEWLLLQSSYHGGKYTFPGGITDQYESPWQGIIREVKEEINIILDKNDLKLLTITNISNKELKDETVIYYFDGGFLNEKQIDNIKPDNKEIVGYKFVPQDLALNFLRENVHHTFHNISEALSKNKIIMIDIYK